MRKVRHDILPSDLSGKDCNNRIKGKAVIDPNSTPLANIPPNLIGTDASIVDFVTIFPTDM
jgi:hypothetical protein